jgi:hypothetical protein
MTAQLPKERLVKTIEQLEHFATNLKWTNVSGAQTLLFAADGLRALLAAHEQEPVAYSLIFKNMDGVLNSSINTNTTFATREKAEAYGKGGRYETQPDGSLKWVADENLDPVVVPLYAHPAPVPAVPVAYRWNYGGSTSWRLTEKMPGPSTNHKCPRVIQALAVIPDCIVSNNESVPAVPDDVLTICQRLIKEYIANKGTSSEFICCVTPSRKTIGTGGVWDDWRALDKAVQAAMLNGGKS